MTYREVMQTVLDALERYQVKRMDFDRFADEIAALHEALAQPEPKPFAVTTGYYSGRATIVPLNPAVVVPMNMALYLTPITPEVPVGWKLVPIDPTPIMMQAGTYAERYSGVNGIYKAMLATAPRIAEGVRFEGTVLQQTGG